MLSILTNIKAIGVTLSALAIALVLQYGGSVVDVVNPPSDPALGALAGPDIPSPYLRWGDLTSWNYNVPMNQGTTTVCSIQSPASTSTLIYAAVSVKTSPATVMGVDISKGGGIGQTATSSTQFLSAKIAAGNRGNFFTQPAASDITEQGAEIAVFAPNTPLNFGFASSTGQFDPTNVAPTGNCLARFIQTEY